MNIWALWAKTHRREPKVTHSLLCHMIDVAEVTRALWDGALTEGMRIWMAERMCLAPDQARQTIAFWIGLHDLGKASPAFQRRYAPAMEELKSAGLSFPRVNVHEPCYHGLISAAVLEELLQSEMAMASLLAKRIARAIGGHHGAWPTPLDIQELKRDAIGRDDWHRCRRELMLALSAVLGPAKVETLGSTEREQNALLMVLSGLTSTADWLGSMEEFFPYQTQVPDIHDYAHRIAERARLALQDLNWLGWRPPREEVSFQELFLLTPRTMQQAIVDLAPRLTKPGLVIIEAPTGTGKTEAALYLADYWARVCQQRGLYVAMPTMATSNQMYSRVQAILKRRHADLAIDLLLVHSQARWMDDHQAHHLQTTEDHPGDRVGDMTWFLARKRCLLAPLGVGTVDQALLSVLQTRHFFVRLFGLSHKTVIFDEIHAYDTYMSTIFQRLLRWLQAVGCSVVLLSATLPAQTRRELLEAYAGPGRVKDLRTPYPAVTWAMGEQIGVIPLPASESRTLTLEWIDREPDALAARLADELREGGCAAVICNTVRRAQEVYLALKSASITSDSDLILFHAQFPLAWRAAIEETVLNCFGKDGKRPYKAIVVATQVIEQSLDLDFDLLVTDLAPVDLVIQRAGRVHRHDRPRRPPPPSNPRVLLCKPAEGIEGPDFGPDIFVYEHYVLLRSWLALSQLAQMTLPAETASLIEAVYGEAPLPTQGLDKALARAKDKMRKHQDTEVFNAMQKMIASPESEDLLSHPNVALEEDNPGLHEAFQALTRLGPPSIPVVCLHRTDTGLRLEPDGEGPEISLDDHPTPELTKQLALHAVSVNHHEAWKHLVAAPVPRGWREHPLLRDHRAVVFINGLCALPGTPYTLRLSRELGLEIRKEV